MNSHTRPTAQQLADATALREFHARQVEEAERKANRALLSVPLAIIVACGLAWALLTWADCTASGVAMCGMALPARGRPIDWLKCLWLRLCIRWAEQDIEGLQQAEAIAQAELRVIPDRMAERMAYVSFLRLRLQNALAGTPTRSR